MPISQAAGMLAHLAAPPWIGYATAHSEGRIMDAKTTNNKSSTLTVGNKNYDFPVYEGTIGPDVVDISKLYGQAGIFT